jgi:polar amino acid transport system permease protein
MWDWSYAWSIVPTLLSGLRETFIVTTLSSAVALALGLVIAVAGWLAPAPARLLLRLLIELARGLPILVVLFFAFYALPEYGISLSAFTTGVLVLGLIYAAYCSEVYRGGIAALPLSTWDSCAALGLPQTTIWVKVVLPLVIRSSIGALGNYVVIIYKQTSLLVAIGVPVLLTAAQTTGYESYRYLEPYTLAGTFYLALNLPSVWMVRLVERRASHGGF